MAGGDHPSSNERNAANEAAFKALPAAGRSAYWARLEDASAARLPLEVLVMCARERRAANALGDLARLYTLLIGKIEPKLLAWAEELLPRGARARANLIEDLMQDTLLELWRELDSDEPTFLTKGFWIRMWRMMTNLAAQIRIAEGLSARTGVIKPTRVPLNKLDQLDRPLGSEDARTLGDALADISAQAEYGLAETLGDLAGVARHLDAGERLLLWNEITETYTQKQLGEILGITDRAVRDRLTALHAKLKALLNPDGPGGGAAGGGSTQGGEE